MSVMDRDIQMEGKINFYLIEESEVDTAVPYCAVCHHAGGKRDSAILWKMFYNSHYLRRIDVKSKTVDGSI